MSGKAEHKDSEIEISFPSPSEEAAWQISSVSMQASVKSQEFDEVGYLRLYPDIAAAIARGDVSSGYDHYTKHGRAEGRRLPTWHTNYRDELFVQSRADAAAVENKETVAHTVEVLFISRGGGILLSGWLDDSRALLDCIYVKGHGWHITFDRMTLARTRRPDVEKELGKGTVQHSFAFTAFAFADVPMVAPTSCRVDIILCSGTTMTATINPIFVEDTDLRDIALLRLASAEFFGNTLVEASRCLDNQLGEKLVAFNRAITARVIQTPYVERFGPIGGKLAGSIVVCLYGKLEYLFLQSALFAKLPGIEEYEFIYVCNSPELAEALLREARAASQVYGLRQTIVVLSGNAGFGAANNAAVREARSDRILNVNPDVFPRDSAWAAKHTALVEALPVEQTRLFGVPLYYDDGSLMHGGMYFDVDLGLSLQENAFKQRRIIRIEHYGKGAPPDSLEFTVARPVPAVTGAFISSHRAWYERLGGFTEDYIFGHYEDADLCLKSIEAGTAPWMHDLRLWHLEGKGSIRRPLHEGGSLVNRWLFSSRWVDLIAGSMLGKSPTNALLQFGTVDPIPAPAVVEPPSPAGQSGTATAYLSAKQARAAIDGSPKRHRRKAVS